METIYRYLGSIISVFFTMLGGAVLWGRTSSKIDANEKKVEKLETIIFAKPGVLNFPTETRCSEDRSQCQNRLHGELAEIKKDVKEIKNMFIKELQK